MRPVPAGGDPAFGALLFGVRPFAFGGKNASTLDVRLVVLSLFLPVFAQEYRATILGEVLDASGAAVPGATVKATKEDTNVSKETLTNAQGFYTIVAREPGRYSVTVSSQGFASHKRAGIVLQVAEKLNLPVSLEVGQVNQEVTVVGEQELIQTTSASRGLVFDPIKVQEIPLNGRQAYMLMRLSPGVMFTQREFGATGFSGTRAWDVNGNFTMNGGRAGTNQFLLNGAPISTDGTFNLAPNAAVSARVPGRGIQCLQHADLPECSVRRPQCSRLRRLTRSAVQLPEEYPVGRALPFLTAASAQGQRRRGNKPAPSLSIQVCGTSRPGSCWRPWDLRLRDDTSTIDSRLDDYVALLSAYRASCTTPTLPCGRYHHARVIFEGFVSLLLDAKGIAQGSSQAGRIRAFRRPW